MDDTTIVRRKRRGTVRVPKGPPKEIVSGSVKPETKIEIIEMAEQDERTVAFIAGKIIEIGLPIFREQFHRKVAAA